MNKDGMKSLDDIFAEEEARMIEHAKSPEAVAEHQASLARNRERLEAEHRRGVKFGWFDEEGNPLNSSEDDDDEDDEDEAGEP